MTAHHPRPRRGDARTDARPARRVRLRQRRRQARRADRRRQPAARACRRRRARILGRNVRIGRPLGVAGLPEAAKGPAFATAVGLMIYPQVAELRKHAQAEDRARAAHDRHRRAVRIAWVSGSETVSRFGGAQPEHGDRGGDAAGRQRTRTMTINLQEAGHHRAEAPHHRVRCRRRRRQRRQQHDHRRSRRASSSSSPTPTRRR